MTLVCYGCFMPCKAICVFMMCSGAVTKHKIPFVRLCLTKTIVCGHVEIIISVFPTIDKVV